jgi:TRAP-type C4-dicarboxylate transport system permease small subunit
MKRWNRIDECIARLEQVLLAGSLSLMVIVAFLQIVLRNFFATGLSWADELVRYCVIWVGFLGAALATRGGKHIRMDVVSRWLSTKRRRALQAFTHLVSTLISAVLTLASIKFVWVEVQMGAETFFGPATWIIQLVIPVTFGIMTIRYAFLSIAEFLQTIHAGPSQNDE